MTRYFVFFLSLVTLFSLGCASKDNPTNNTSNPNSTQQASTAPAVKVDLKAPEPAKDYTAKPALDGKTAMDVFNHLKGKGWKLNEATAVDIAPFSSEEAVGFNRPDRIGFLVMRYDSLDTAQAKFGQVDVIYRNKFGRAVTAKNFIIATFGGQKKINSPDFNQLSEEEYLKLQQDLVDFCNL